jgi:hypothetical protein
LTFKIFQDIELGPWIATWNALSGPINPTGCATLSITRKAHIAGSNRDIFRQGLGNQHAIKRITISQRSYMRTSSLL